MIYIYVYIYIYIRACVYVCACVHVCTSIYMHNPFGFLSDKSGTTAAMLAVRCGQAATADEITRAVAATIQVADAGAKAATLREGGGGGASVEAGAEGGATGDLGDVASALEAVSVTGNSATADS